MAYKLIDAAQARSRGFQRTTSGVPRRCWRGVPERANFSNGHRHQTRRTGRQPRLHFWNGRSPENPSALVLTSFCCTDRVSTVDDGGIDNACGTLVTESFDYDGGRQVTVYVPPDPPEAVVFAGDGQVLSRWGELFETADVPSTMIIGVHRLAEETLRLHEYSPRFDAKRFAAHERFFVHDVRQWTTSRFEVALPAERTAVFGVSASAELALALGLRHPDVYGTVFCASPGAGYQPPAVMPGTLPRTYLVAGTLEPFFLANATRWADALRDAGADVVMSERIGSHGDVFWREELPLMVDRAFGS